MLKGKNAVVTGSTSGIGLGIADALAEAGANVIINGLGSEKDNRAAIDQVAAHETRVIFSPANMMEPDEISGLIDMAETDFGALDILVNNAGIQHVAPVEEFPAGKWDAIIAINLSSAFHTIRAAMPGMKKRRFGRIINTASAHSLVASPFKAAYVAAKHGLAGLTKVIALEGAEHGITCNAISPGYVLTPLVEGQLADTARARGITEEEVKNDVMLTSQPTKQFVKVEELGALAVFLCTDAANNITGANLPVEGGWTAQ
ncbi:MAG: 3-hydroxybutyrate dehydrogenase [Hyphomicrobiaceae bacterium]